MSMYVRVSNEDGTYTEKKVYSEGDMISFGQMCLAYVPIADGYCRRHNIGGEAPKTIKQIFQKWEEQK